MTYTLHHGDCLDLLHTLPDASVDSVVTDPPYSSGGLFRDDRQASPRNKYQNGGVQVAYPAFSGDNRDQRSFAYWCVLWLAECQRIMRPGGYILLFTDWRQLPTTTDAMQAGGYIWRGIVVWNKGQSARAPHTGYFRHQCEYIVWGTNGPLGKAEGRGPFPGCVCTPIRPSEKQHITAKPIELMRQLVRCVPPGGVILDPFAGSGTTGVAAIEAGCDFIGIEREAAYVEIARARLDAATTGARFLRSFAES